MKLSTLARRLGLSICAAILSSSAFGETITGQVVNSLGFPVPGVNLNARNFAGGGGSVTLLNDGTDANGFFVTTIPAGTFTIEFIPPQPPSSNALVTEVAPVLVPALGTTNMGTVVLTAGVALSGRITNPAGVGVPAINFDVIDASGNNVTLVYDETNALGDFAFASPAGTIELRIDPSGVAGQTLAPRFLSLSVASDTSLGIVQLQQGFVVSALVRGPTGAAINGCDVDVLDPATGQKLYTPGDTSNSSGFVDFVVPAGTWWIDLFAPFALHLAGKRVVQTVSGATSLGVQTLSAGWVMSGTLRDCSGAPVVSGNVDLKDHANPLLDLPLDGSGANAAGSYQVIVPQSVAFDVHFKGALGLYAQDVHANVTALSNFTLDGVLGPAFTEYCFGDGSGTPCPCGNASPSPSKAGCANSLGTGGRLVGSGRACVSGDTMVLTATAVPNSSGLYFQGTAQANAGLGVVFGDGLRCAAGTVIRLGTKAAAANTSAYPSLGDVPISQKGLVAPGATRNYQVWYRNSASFCNAETFNLTGGVRVTWVP